MSVRRVLIPIDFSKTSEVAARAGALLAARLGAEAQLVHVVEIGRAPVDPAQQEAFEAEVMRRTKEAMDRLVAELSGENVELTSVICKGDVGLKLLAAASEPPASLIVIGSSGRSDDEPFHLGSVAAYLIRSASCPVLVIRQKHAKRLPKNGLFLRPMATIDYSRFSEITVQYAAALSAPESPIELYHALFVPRFELFPEGEIDEMYSAIFKLNQSKEEGRLKMVATHSGIDRPFNPVVETGRAAELIINHIDFNAIDLVVTGAHGRDGEAGLLIGSVADRLLRESAAPVLCIPDAAASENS